MLYKLKDRLCNDSALKKSGFILFRLVDIKQKTISAPNSQDIQSKKNEKEI